MRKILCLLLLPFSFYSTAFGNGVEAFSYEVNIVPNVKERTLSGETKIGIKVTEAGVKDLRFSINKLTIEQVSVQGEPAAFNVENGDLVIRLKRPLNADSTVEAAITYKGGSAPGVNFGESYFYTAYFSCHWMICLEDPYPKATISMRLTVPKQYRTVASGKLVSEKNVSEGFKELFWEQKRPYSTYLFGFATGEFNEAQTKIGSTELRYLGVRDSVDMLKAKFKPTGEMLRFFEEKAGVPYPHEVYTQVLIPGSVAQENSSFSVIGNDELDPILNDPQEDWVIAHELAHQWWGNLLTCRTWQHVWLNEGVTVFLVAAYKEQRWGKAAYDKELQIIRRRYQRAIDANFDVPLAYSKEYPSLKMQRAIVYSKAAVFLDALRTSIGDKVFWKGLKDYTQKHVGGSVESKDFQVAIEAASGKDLSALFSKWVYEK